MPGARHLLAVAPGVVLAVGLLSASACTTVPDADDEDRVLPYACGDVVVTGRIQSGAYHPIEDEGDLLGHGRVDAVITVRRHIKGSDVPKSLSVDYVAHVNLRDDLEFMFVLKPLPDGRYELRTAQVMEFHPRLAARCDQMG